MKVLFLGTAERLDPWYSDVLRRAEGRWNIILFDPARSVEEQFRGTSVVVDQGGGNGTRERIDAAISAGAQLWQVLGTGVDHTDVAYFLQRQLPLANTPGQFSASALAEHALFLMLHFAKNFAESQTSVRSGVLCQPMNEELEGKTLALLGVGASGQHLARRAKAMGMRVVGIDICAVSDERLRDMGISFFGGLECLERVLGEADYLSLHVPLTASTRHLVNCRTLSKMKPSSVLINVARGGIVDENALHSALVEKRLRGAGLDVFAAEPVDPSHPLLQLRNVVATPHNAGVTFETSRRRAEAVVTNIQRISEGLSPLYQITSVE